MEACLACLLHRGPGNHKSGSWKAGFSPRSAPPPAAREAARVVTKSLQEDELVEGLVERDEASVATFLERYRALFFHCIAHFESDPAAREDLYQDLVLYVLQRLDADRFDRTKGSFGTWLYRVSWCRCVDLKRKQGARCRPQFAPLGEELPEREDEAPTPGEAAENSEMGAVVHAALGKLEREERILLEARFMEGCTLSEIAARLSISLEQSKYRLRRATIALRRVLLQQLSPEEAREI